VANIKSQIKRNRQNLVRRERNKAVRSELRTRAKAAVAAAEAGEDDADIKLREAVRRIDTAAAKGVIHKNQAARRKARLQTQVNEASAEPAED
jgi:small subunit ribosomal protein S20